jgi:MFS family permease
MILELFQNKNFLKIWVAQLSSQLAANLLNFALIIRVFELSANTKFANISVSLLVLAFGVPSIIFAVLAGAYVDHMDRKKVLVITNVVRAVLVLAFLLFESNRAFVYIMVFIISVASQVFTPAESAALPKLVDKKHLVVANSLFLFTLYSSFILGYSLAGPIISAFGPNAVYWATSAAFVLAGLLSLGLPSLKAIDKGLDFRAVNREVLVTVRQTTKKIWKTPSLSFPIANLTIGQMMIGIIAVVAPGLAVILFNQSLAQVSFKIIVPAALGMIVGAAMVGQVFRNSHKAKVILLGIAIAVLSLVGIGTVRFLSSMPLYTWLVIGLTFLLGLSNALVGVSAQTLLQEHSTDEERGKIFGTLNMMMNLAAALPVLLAGVTADLISPASVLTISGLLIAVYGVYQFLTLKKHELVDR